MDYSPSSPDGFRRYCQLLHWVLSQCEIWGFSHLSPVHLSSFFIFMDSVFVVIGILIIIEERRAGILSPGTNG